MYIIEKILKIFIKKNPQKKYTNLEIEACEHFFLPIDSDGIYLACTKCGKLIKKDS